MTEADVDFAYSFFEPSHELMPTPATLVVPVSVINEFYDNQFKLCLLALACVLGSAATFYFVGSFDDGVIVFLILAVATMFWVGWRSFTHE